MDELNALKQELSNEWSKKKEKNGGDRNYDKIAELQQKINTVKGSDQKAKYQKEEA
jgi:hypothetical protein